MSLNLFEGNNIIFRLYYLTVISHVGIVFESFQNKRSHLTLKIA